jgi:hypothetical protein
MTTTNDGGRIRGAFRTVGRGFLLGVGLGIAFACAYLVMLQVTISRTQAAYSEVLSRASASSSDTVDISPPTEAAAKEIVLSDVEELRHDGITAIIGSAKNTGKKPARGVQVQADLFDHGKFVDQYSTYISGRIGPGESKHFKILCGCKDSPPAPHDSYKLEVISGY